VTEDGGAIGDRLRACRATAGLSQEELAERSGVSVRAIRDIERGRTRCPNRDSARLLAGALGLAGGELEAFLALARRPVAGPAPAMVPYRGLSAFREQDAGLFFGREEAAARVLELMSAALGGTGLIVVSGVSGAGKSSLLRAGVLPRLRQAGLAAAPEAASWPCLAFVPGSGPVGELAVQIAPLARVDAAALRGQLAVAPAGFALTARQAALSADGTDAGCKRVVLVVDQGEQLFTACESQPERQAFFTALRAAAAGEAGQPPAALVVLVVRADFEARLADFPELAAAVQDRYLLTAMTRRQLRLAITQPAAVAGSRVEEDLVQVLLEEAAAPAPGPSAPGTAAGAGALPLLSHALDQAWRTRSGQELMLADYERTGGIEGAVAASAQRAYQALTPAQQQAARQVLTRLAVPGSDGTDTALPVARAALTAVNSGAQAKDVEVVLERFAAERLLTLDAGTVAISHEVLLTAWPLLRDDWLADARADRLTRARLHAAADEWAQGSRDLSYLYSGSRLDAATATAARIRADPRQAPLGRAEKDFLRASHRTARRRARTRRQLTAVLLGLLAALTTVSVAVVRAGQAASAQRNIAISGLLISQSQATSGVNATVSRREAIAAWTLNPSSQARIAMLSAAANPQTATFTAGAAGSVPVAYSPDGKTLATGSPGGARLWNIATGHQIGKPLLTGLPGSDLTSSIAFSPDGKALAAAGPDGAWLWNIATGHEKDESFQLTQVNSVAFSPDGKTLATGSPGGARLWNIATGHQIGSPLDTSDQETDSVAFSLDGKTLATGGPGGARLWNIAAGRQIGSPLDTSDQETDSVAFSPDGKTLATGGPGGMARLWDVTAGQQASVPLTIGDSDLIDAVAFSPDGKTLATGGMDGMARLWNVTTAKFRQVGSPASGDRSQIAWIGFSPAGKALLSSDENGTVHLWDAATGQQVGKPIPAAWDWPWVPPSTFHPRDPLPISPSTTRRYSLPIARNYSPTWPLAYSPTWPLTVSPDGKTLAAGGMSGALLWDISTGRQVGKPFVGGIITALAFSSDGKALTTAGPAYTIQWWDVATRQPIKPAASYADGIVLAFSPGGKKVVMDSADGITVWDVNTGQQIGGPLTGGPALGCYAATLSPDGKTLACVGYGGAWLWNVATGQQITGPLADTAGDLVNSAAFSPDGKTLATGGPSGARLWNVATGQQIGAPLAVPGSPQADAVAFSPDGKTLATGGVNGTTQLWNVSYLTETLAQLCAQARGSFTSAEWARHVPPGTPYRDACPQAPLSIGLIGGKKITERLCRGSWLATVAFGGVGRFLGSVD
jgi:WD40 repeat protein/transcriptional regulator with XRE-family HTH domain